MKKYVVSDKKIIEFNIYLEDTNIDDINKSLNPYLFVSETNIARNLEFYITNTNSDEYTFFDKNYSYKDNEVYISDYNYLSIKRIILDIYSRLLEKYVKGIFIHASAVQKENAIIFVGKRGSGKTYNMINEILNNNAGFISNDKVFISENGEVIGFPTSIGVRKKTLILLTDLYNDEQNSKNYEEENDTYNKNIFTVLDFAKCFNCDIVPRSKLGNIISLDGNELLESHKIDSVYDEQAFVKKMIPIYIQKGK